MRTKKGRYRRWLCAVLAGLMTLTSVPAVPAFAKDKEKEEPKPEKEWTLEVYHAGESDAKEAESIYSHEAKSG